MSEKKRIIAFYGRIPSTTDSAGEQNNDVAPKQYMRIPTGIRADEPDSPLRFGNLDDPGITSGSIACHVISGSIRYNDIAPWLFSTVRFMHDLEAAEANPNIAAHLLLVDSCGGEAFGCHEAFEAVKALKKPCYALIDSVAASAGYYLAAAADKIYTDSIFSQVGCIGVMCVFYNEGKLLEQLGIEEHEYYSNYSPLKNKVFNDAENGEGDEFVKRFLDPMAIQFIDDVASVRTKISDEAKQGETWYSPEAMAAGLIDGQCTIDEVVAMLQMEARPASPIDINAISI